MRAVIARIMSFATSLLKALFNIKHLSFMLVYGVLLIFMISILLSLDGLKDFNGYKFLWPFKICWYYALLLVINVGYISESLLKLHIIQQSRKPSFDREMASSSDVVKPKVFDGANFKRW